MAPELLLTLIAAIIVIAGLFSIAGALKRTANRPPHSGDSGGDGGPVYGAPHHGRDGRLAHDDRAGDGDRSDGSGDAGGESSGDGGGDGGGD